MKKDNTRPDFVIGIGASAGGLKAFEALLPGLPMGKNTACVFLQHSVEHKSGLKDLLAKISPLPILMAAEGMPVAGNILYLCPPGAHCEVSDGRFLVKTDHPHGPRHTIDGLFSSLARDFPERVAGIILSGTGQDGVEGLQEIKAAGGWTLIQDPATAHFPGMPRSALDLHLADFVLTPEEMGAELLEIIRFSATRHDLGIASDQEKLHILLEILENETGFNFRRYKEPMLRRRIKRRMVANKVDTLAHYLLQVKNTPEEAHLLVKDIFITVTGFFRDRQVYQRLEKLLGQLLHNTSGNRTLRIWSAGCATGEEPYSITLLLAGLTDSLSNPPDIKIFATDVDADNIRFARKGVYSAKAVEHIPRELLHRCFDKVEDGWRVDAKWRDMVVFARHDVIADSSFSRMDLICCRNLLIYFNGQTQEQLLKRFHFALNEDGYLLLGAAENSGNAQTLFKTVDRQNRLYQKLAVKDKAPTPVADLQVIAAPDGNSYIPASWQQHMWSLYFEEYAPAAVLVNSRLNLIHVHGNVQAYLRLTEGDFNVNLLHLARPELKTDMQMVLQQALRTGTTTRSRVLQLETGGRKRKTDQSAVTLVAIPRHVAGGGKTVDELLLVFEEKKALLQADTGPLAATGDGGENQDEHIRALEEELTVTRDQLQSNIEALEASNQELQSVNEEFRSTLEELQSTNEEFQTTNEELESTNEELNSVNDEITAKSRELVLTNKELDTILNATLAGFVIVDEQLQVTRYSDSCRQLFDLWPEQLDNIHQLMTRLEGLTTLAPKLQKVLHAGKPDKLALEIGGRAFNIRLFPVFEDDDKAIRRLIIAFYDETAARERARESELLAAIVRGSIDAIIVHDLKGNIRHWNAGAQGMFGYNREEALALNVRDLIARGEKSHYDDFVLELANGSERHSLEIRGLTNNGAVIDISSSASIMRDYNGKVDGIAVIFRDISEKNTIEDKLNAVVESTPDPFIIVGADGIIQRINRQAEKLFGYTRKELVGLSFKTLVPERFRKQHDVYTRHYQQKPMMRQMGAGIDLSCLTKSGEEVAVDISLSPVVVGNDTTIMVRFRDIRGEKQEKTRLEEALRKADEANRTKTRFLAAASHDLRQPLQSISMYLGALGGAARGKEKIRIIGQARMAVDTTNKLLNALLNISKLESGKVVPEIETFAINRLLDRVYNTEAPQAGDKNQRFSMVPSRVHVLTDPALLEQLVTNLVANAVKYSPPHGHIVLGCRRRNGFLNIQVLDNGPGIRSTELDAIFEEYRQLDFNGHYLGKGLGLGLSIVKHIAELLDLKLEVKSQPGRGSSFSVLVPVAKGKPQKKKPARPAEKQKIPRTGKVLLIEDDAAVLDSTTLFLEMSGYTVIPATNSGEAMTALKNGKPDVIVTDYGLAQEENGIELVKRLRKKLQEELPVIIITGDTSDLREREAKAAGCSLINKPVEAQALIRALENLLVNNNYGKAKAKKKVKQPKKATAEQRT